MTFEWPAMLYLLVLVPVFVAIYLHAQADRRKAMAQYGGLINHPQAISRRPGGRRHIPPALFLIGMTILIVALARPQATVYLPRQEGTVILAFDASGSMAATDMSPTRMEAAKAAARDFVAHQPSTVQVGIVAFSDNGFSVQTPTNDPDALLAAINRISPQRGTSLAQGINASLNTIFANPEDAGGGGSQAQPTPTPTPVPKGTIAPDVIILLTDGENNESPDPLAASQAAADRGVRIYTVGIGSAQGTNLHINGVTVHTSLNEQELQQIAQMTGGEYYNAQTAQDLISIYDHLDPQLVIKPQKTEITALLIGGSAVAFLLGGILSMLWFSRIP